jgi:recombination protein RecA
MREALIERGRASAGRIADAGSTPVVGHTLGAGHIPSAGHISAAANAGLISTASRVPNAAPRTDATPAPAVRRPATWTVETFAGRLVEISGDRDGAALTLALRLVLEAQQRREPVAWIGRAERPFFPPDVADTGIDLAALPVVWAPDDVAAARAADLLVRSGAFGLLVLDLPPGARLALDVQTRLAGLARQHAAAIVCLTAKAADRPSLGGLVSVRAHAVRTGRDGGRFDCEARVIKDKRRGPGWRHAEVCLGPDGLH